MMLLRRGHLLLILPVFILLQACGSAGLKDYYAAHGADFEARTGYISHRITRGDFMLEAREFGEAGDQPTLILMHGFPDSMRLYDWLVPELMSDRHIIAFDFLGWGDSDKPRDHLYNVASLRADLEAVLAAFELDSVVLVVHDASGQPGIDWALDNPEKTAGLVLLNTYYGPMETLRAPEAIELFSSTGLRRDLSVLMTSVSDSFWLSRYNAQMAKFISTQALREPFQKILGHQSLSSRRAFFGLNKVLLQEVQSRQDKQRSLGELTVPVRIIFGADDPYLNSGVARDFHRLLLQSELFLLEGAGHFVQVDKPGPVAALIRDFAGGTSK